MAKGLLTGPGASTSIMIRQGGWTRPERVTLWSVKPKTGSGNEKRALNAAQLADMSPFGVGYRLNREAH